MLREMVQLGHMVRPVGYWPVECDASAVPLARKLLSERMANGWPAGVCRAARVVATELLSNAVRHGRGPVTLSVNLRRNGLAVEVGDGSSLAPVLRENASMLDESGRGLLMVDQLSAGWGYWTVPGYKVVWAILNEFYE